MHRNTGWQKTLIYAYRPPLSPINENNLNKRVEKHAEENGLAIYHPEKYTRILQVQHQYPSITDIVITKKQGKDIQRF